MISLNKPFGDFYTLLDSFIDPTDSPNMSYIDMRFVFMSALVDYRIKHGLTQRQLAQQLGVSQAMVSKYESGENDIKLRTLCDVCNKLGLSAELSIHDATLVSPVEIQSPTVDPLDGSLQIIA